MLRGQLDDAHGPGLGKFAIPSCLTVRVTAGRANRTQGGLLRRNPFPPAEPSLLTAPGVGGQRQLHRHRAAWTPAPRKSCGRFHSTNERVQLRQVLRGRVWARKVALNKFHRRGTAEDLAAHDTPPKSTRPQSTTIAARRTIAGHIGDDSKRGHGLCLWKLCTERIQIRHRVTTQAQEHEWVRTLPLGRGTRPTTRSPCTGSPRARMLLKTTEGRSCDATHPRDLFAFASAH